jgi:hypothetical protein
MVLSAHNPSQFCILLALQAFADVLVHQFVLLHHHVHGPVPLTAVGVPVEQVGVGVVAELNGALHTPLIHVEFSILQAAVEPVHVPLHAQVWDPPHDPVEYPDGVPIAQVFATPPQTPFALHGALAILQRPDVDHPFTHWQFHVSVVQQLVVLLIGVQLTHWNLIVGSQTPFSGHPQFGIVQAASVPPPLPVQVQVAFPPHEPFDGLVTVPASQVSFTIPLQAPFTTTGGGGGAT